MMLFRKTRILLKQFIHNMAEDDWASRHIADRGPDVPIPSEGALPGRSVSSLSLALRQMGLVRQNLDTPNIEMDPYVL